MFLEEATVDGRQCFFTMESASFRSRFLSQLNNSFGSGGMSLAFNDAQFSSFIQYLKQESMGSLTIRKAVGIIGRQSYNVWVLGPDIQIDVDGNVIPPNERSHLWMDAIIHDGLCSVAPEEVLPVLLAPFRPDTSFLHTLVEDIREHNFFPSLLMAGGSVLALHYSTILQSGGCPIVVAQGCSETGKSTALRVGLSLFGMFWIIHCTHPR